MRVVFAQDSENVFRMQLVSPLAEPVPHDYSHLQDHHPATQPEGHVGNPVFENPCSYDAVAKVLRDIGRQGGLKAYGGCREWLVVMLDGLPYNLALSLIERVFVCVVCGSQVTGVSECTERTVRSHPGQDSTGFKREFDWVILRPGPGHVEMNMLKTYVKMNLLACVL